jgi:hypothetical protein
MAERDRPAPAARTSIVRNAFFVSEGGSRQHRFTQEEIELFMPGVSLEQFVVAQ